MGFVATNTQTKKDNPFLPAPTQLGTKEEQDRFVTLVVEHRTIQKAALAFHCSRSTVYRRRREFPEFDQALSQLQTERDLRDLEELEAISVEQAKDPRKTTERIFQLNALNRAKYRPTGSAGYQPNINITVGTLQLDNRRQYLVQQGIKPPAKGQRLAGSQVTKVHTAPEPVEGREPGPLVDEDDINV